LKNLKSIDDEVARAQAGDTAAFAVLLRQHQSALRKQLRWLCHGDHALADDLAQASFLQAWTHLRQFQAQSRFGTWLHRIAYNQFLMHARSHRALLDWDDEATPDEAAHPAGREASDPALRLDVQAALRQLPAAEQAAVLHCYYLDLSHEEAALVLNLPLGTLKTHVLRAKARLRLSLAAWAPEPSV